MRNRNYIPEFEKVWRQAEQEWRSDSRTDVEMSIRDLDAAAVRLNAMHNHLTDDDMRDIALVWELLGNIIGVKVQ